MFRRTSVRPMEQTFEISGIGHLKVTEILYYLFYHALFTISCFSIILHSANVKYNITLQKKYRTMSTFQNAHWHYNSYFLLG